MPELTLENLAKRLDNVERELSAMKSTVIPPTGDWRSAVGMFTGSEFSLLVDEEARKIREADREAARLEFGE